MSGTTSPSVDALAAEEGHDKGITNWVKVDKLEPK
jgi:hypothetical protein